MSIIKTDAFVLKTFRYKETSKIVVLFTKDLGKVSAIVKGARNYKSKLCGVLETMNYVSTVIYFKENRNLQLIATAEYKTSFSDIITNFDKLQIAFRIIETLNRSIEDHEINKNLFELLKDTYAKLNNANKNFQNCLLLFQINLVKLLGLNPDFSQLENKHQLETFFQNNEFNCNDTQLNALKLIYNDHDSMEHLDIDGETIMKLINIYEKYLLLHTHSLRFYNSNKVFKELNQLI